MTAMMFVPEKRDGKNDPFVINPKGMRVQIREDRLAEYLAKGFVLENSEWRPTPTSLPEEEDFTRDYPLPLQAIKKEIEAMEDKLETTVI